MTVDKTARAHRFGPQPDQARNDRVRDMVLNNTPYRTIADELGITKAAVAGIVMRNRASWGLGDIKAKATIARVPRSSARGGDETAAIRPVPGRGREKPGQPIPDASPKRERPRRPTAAVESVDQAAPEAVVSPGVGVSPEEGAVAGLRPSSGVFFGERGRAQCAFPLWDSYGPLPRADQLMVCGDPVIDGEDQVYCRTHQDICRVRVTVKIDRVAGRARHL